MKKIKLTYNDLANCITESVKKCLSSSVLQEYYNPLGNIDVDEVNSISYTKDIDEEGDEDEDGNPIPYISYDIECFDIHGEHLGYADNLSIDEIEDYFGENVAQEILNDNLDKGSVDDIIDTSLSDINNVEEVNNIAKKIWDCYPYEEAPNERGYILTDGTFIYFGDNIDHVSITNIDGMTVGKFISLGNIRVSTDSFDLEKEPTPQQRKALRILIQNNPHEDLYFDINQYSGSGMYSNTIVSRHYKTHDARFVLGQIDNYFANGIKPKEYFEESKKSSLINEMTSPIVWHFTTPENLVSILQNDEFVLSDAYERANGMDQALTGWSDKHTYFLSTTRSKSSHDGYSKELKRKSSDGTVRIELDGDKLNTITHGKASNFHGKRDLEYGDNTSIKGRYTDNFVNKQYNLNDIKNDRDYNQNEKEDTVWYHKEVLPNASRYIRRIDVLVYTKTDIIEEIENLADEYGIPCYFYDDENSFNMQNDNYFDEDRLFQQCLQKAMDKINNSEGGWSPYYIFDDVIDINGGEALQLSGKWNIMNDDCEFVSDKWYDDLDSLMADFGYEYYN